MVAVITIGIIGQATIRDTRWNEVRFGMLKLSVNSEMALIR